MLNLSERKIFSQKPNRLVAPQVSLLSYEDLDSAVSIDEITMKYGEIGIDFRNDHDLIRRVKIDWKIETGKFLERALTSTHAVTEFPVHKIDLGKNEGNIYGIIHTAESDPRILDLIRRNLSKHPVVLAEQNLGSHAEEFKTVEGAIAIPDQLPYGPIASSFPLYGVFISLIYERLFPKIKQIPISSPVAFDVILPGALQPPVVETSATAKAVQQMSLLYLVASPDIFNTLPTHILLDYKIRNRKRLSNCEQRSLYMAEFLRAFDPERFLECHNNIPYKKSDYDPKLLPFISGIGHVKEIDFFSRKPGLSKKIQERAIRDAHSLEQNHDTFRSNYLQERTIAIIFPGIVVVAGCQIFQLVFHALKGH